MSEARWSFYEIVADTGLSLWHNDWDHMLHLCHYECDQLLQLWHYEWDEMIKLTSCVGADDRFMSLRVRQGDQFMTSWMKSSIFLLHHISLLLKLFVRSSALFQTTWVRTARTFMAPWVKPSDKDKTKWVISAAVPYIDTISGDKN